MTTEQLKDNGDIYKFLLTLENLFQKNERVDLANKIRNARSFAMTSASEFLMETETVLIEIKKTGGKWLSIKELQQIEAALNQIRIAFARSNGQP